jgi:CubicO group peptidase (beta-lactamase class C family)
MPYFAMTSSAGRRLPGMRSTKQAMDEHVEAGVPGLAWAIAHGHSVDVGWAGTADLARTRPVARDTIFRIASMSKPVTAVAALALVEAGTLRLDDPVDDLLPELADRRVLRDPDGPVDDTVPAARPITVRDLLTFRLGLGLDFGRFGRQPHMDRLSALGIGVAPPSPGAHPDADEYLARLGSLPLEFQPGERWLYHTGADVLGVLLARAEGASLGDVLRRRVLDPLGMRDTSFAVPTDDVDRFTDCVSGTELYDAIDGQWSRPATFESGGGGLVSTVDDYLAFAQMLRAGGAPVLSRPAVALMTTDHLTAEQREASSPEPDGSLGWGFCVGVTARQTDETSVGTYGWNGGLGSTWANDPVTDVITILLTNQMFTSPSLPAVHRALRTCAYADLAQPKA